MDGQGKYFVCAAPDAGESQGGDRERPPAAYDGVARPVWFGSDIVRTRSYDLTVTYDKYYQTPRLWLFGYDEVRCGQRPNKQPTSLSLSLSRVCVCVCVCQNGVPLKPEQIFEDVMTQYATKTVTVDPHPCTGIPTASIHPCRSVSAT